MSELQTIRRITVYSDSAIESILLEEYLKLGANGYTVVDCRGKGEHDSIADPFGTSSRVMFIRGASWIWRLWRFSKSRARTT